MTFYKKEKTYKSEKSINSEKCICVLRRQKITKMWKIPNMGNTFVVSVRVSASSYPKDKEHIQKQIENKELT